MSPFSIFPYFRLPEETVPKTLVLALSLCFSGNVMAGWHDQEGAFCRALPDQMQTIEPAQNSGGEPLAQDFVRITADKLAGQIAQKHRAQGDVIVEYHQDVLNADWIDYDQIEQIISAGDSFTLTREDGQSIQGKQLHYRLNERSGVAQDTAFEIEQNGRRLQGVGGELRMDDKNHYAVKDVQFNTCQAGDKSWYIAASEVRTNHETGVGVAKHARLVFHDIPILYTPWADFPMNGQRKSGLLLPTLAIRSDGTQIDLPYYLNLAPNYDATITPSIITERGARIGGEFRYLKPKYSGSLEATYMPDDRSSEFDHRYEVKAQHQHRFSQHLSGGVFYHQVSDDDYYRDFHGRNDIAENIHLDRRLWLDYRHDVGGGALDANFLVQKYQTLGSLKRENEPYAILPRLSAQWQKNLGQAGVLNIEGQAAYFDHEHRQSGSRVVIYPSLQWDFSNHWGYIRPKVGLHATQYWLNSFENEKSRSVSRVLPITSIDSAMTFERQTRLWGNDYLQTLEPHVFYHYIPQKQQNDLPNFDTSENAFSYEQLFRENIYSGNDRINASNSISLGIQTRLLNRETGKERFRAGLGQKFYLSQDNVLLDGTVSKNTRNQSDFVAFSNGWLNDNWYADTHWHWSQNDSETKRFDAGVLYNPEAGKAVSVRFKYGLNEEIYNGFYGKLRHVDLAAQWPINNSLYAIGRLNYSIKPWRALEQTLGLEYRNPCGCWGVSVVGQRYVSDLNQYKNAFFITLQLKNLSNFGKNPHQQLQLGIPGYTKTNEVSRL